VSVNHVNFSDPSYVHEAVVLWVEDIRENNFTVCVTQAGRNEKKNGQELATVDWLAYQGAPDGGVSGSLDMPTWWTGTNCRAVSLPSVSLADFKNHLKLHLRCWYSSVSGDTGTLCHDIVCG